MMRTIVLVVLAAAVSGLRAQVPQHQVNLAVASLEFTGTECSPTTGGVKTYTVDQYTTMTIASGPNGDQAYALLWTPGFAAVQGPGLNTAFGIVDFSIAGFAVMDSLINGIIGQTPLDLLLGTTTSLGSRSITFGIGAGTPGATQATYQGLVTSPIHPQGFRITRATQIDYGFSPGGTPVGVTDGTQVQILTGGLSIPFYGATYSSVYVSDDGFVTFGAPDATAFGSTAAMLSGPPRIAGAWRDLNPVLGSYVNYTVTPNSLEVSWLDIPESPNTGANDFSVLITATGSITLTWYAMTTPDGTTGISPGGVNPGTGLPFSPVGPAWGASMNLSPLIFSPTFYVGGASEALFQVMPAPTWPSTIPLGFGNFSPCTGFTGFAWSLGFWPLPSSAPGSLGYKVG